MNRYEPSTPRLGIGCAAAALAALTIGAMVVLPAQLGPASADPYTVAAVTASPPAPIEVAISPARIDVIAVRAPDVAWALTDAARPNCKPES